MLRRAKLLALAGCLGSLASCAVSDDAAFSTSSVLSGQPTTALSTSKIDMDPPEAQNSAETAKAAVDEAPQVAAVDEAASSEAGIEVASSDTPSPQEPEGELAAVTDADSEQPSAERTQSAGTDQPAAEGDTAPSSGSTALAVVQEPETKPSPFARLFSRSDAPDNQPVVEAASTRIPETADEERDAAPDAQELAEGDDIEMDEDEPSPVTTASIRPGNERARIAVASGDGPILPGVREVGSLYQFSARDSFDYNSYENDGAVIQVASAAGLAALAGNRLNVQHARVDVSCLKPRLVQTLRQIEGHFGRPVVVTSGYRNRQHNRRVGGARESKHMSCEAADIQVAGVSKWQIAEFVRTLPGRGGVGTYCHTESVHVDIGSKRDWNWRCRRRK
jgi:uncharacterized protein YcbK (DUF882 family)